MALNITNLQNNFKKGYQTSIKYLPVIHKTLDLYESPDSKHFDDLLNAFNVMKFGNIPQPINSNLQK